MKLKTGVLAFAGLFCAGACGSETPGAGASTEGLSASLSGVDGAMATGNGLVWERDKGFLLSGHTVPTVLPVRDGFLLFTSAPQRGQIALHRSRDGVSWTSEGVLDLGGLPEECGRTALDVSVQEAESGYRVIVETWLRSSGLMDPSGREAPQEESPTVLCALESTDAERWVPVEQALRWPGLSKSWPSGLEFVGDSSSGLFYFVDTFPDLDGIRMGRLEGDVLTAVGRRATLLPEAHVDPMPVALENGGIRLYHSRSLEGILAVSDSTDGQNFGESRPLKGLSGQVCHAPPERPSPPDACFLDPALIQAVDGRLVMYFSVFESLPGGVERRGIGRAFAVD